MTWPAYKAHVAKIDGEPVRLSRAEAETLLVLLLSPPDGYLRETDWIAHCWPNPDDEPDNVEEMLRNCIRRLRSKRVKILNAWGWGYQIPLEARG